MIELEFIPKPLNVSKIEGWERKIQNIVNLDDGVRKKIQRPVAEVFFQRISNYWYAQFFPLAPLSPRYLKWKKRKKYDTRILLATHKLIQSLEIFSFEDKTIAGFRRGKTASFSDMDLVDLMKLLERGKKKTNLPPRPIFKLTHIHLSGLLKKEAQKAINRELKKALSS